jgi:hypothetical protein
VTRFVVSRVSDSRGTNLPCDGAERGTYVYRDQIRQQYKPDDWEATGANHRGNKSMAYRDLERECWYVEIATLDDLLRFVQKHGDVIVGNAFMAPPNVPAIAIYDGYVE